MIKPIVTGENNQEHLIMKNYSNSVMIFIFTQLFKLEFFYVHTNLELYLFILFDYFWTYNFIYLFVLICKTSTFE